jgi:predicted DNA-binding protein (MmcQ/YjbR family)
MTKDGFLEWCGTIVGASMDKPFKNDYDTVVLRHKDSRKWFGIVMNVKGKWLVNLKTDPMEGDLCKSAYEGITPAYHMNKRHWISVYFLSDVPDDLLCGLTRASFALTK